MDVILQEQTPYKTRKTQNTVQGTNQPLLIGANNDIQYSSYTLYYLATTIQLNEKYIILRFFKVKY